jgi:glucose/arabinose dehydrogenase
MRRLALLATLVPFLAFAGDKPAGPTLAGKGTPLAPLVTGLKNPTAVCVTPAGRVFVTTMGDIEKDGDGAVMEIKDGKAVPFAIGLDDPRGIVSWQQFLFVADKSRIWRIDPKGKPLIHVDAKAFPTPPLFLCGIEVEMNGTLYVSDFREADNEGALLYRITPDRKARVLVDSKKDLVYSKKDNWFGRLWGLRQLDEYHLHALNPRSGELLQLRLRDGQISKLAGGFGAGVAGITFDYFGRLYVCNHLDGKVHVIPRPGEKPVLLASRFSTPGLLSLSRDGKSVLVPDLKTGTLTAVPAVVPGAEIDDRPLPVKIELAFPDLQWTGWEGVTEKGKINPHRPLVLTHPGDGSGRVVVATQHGVLHTFPNDQKAGKTKVFLDIQDRVRYDDNQNEEGFLGLAFHPKYKSNGEFFVFYTPKKERNVNVVSRFKVSKDDPDRADPASEEILLRFKKPFWNHDGGTLCFGPDGYLYVTHGDGGAANDPFGNGQKLSTLLGKVLRIDVDRKDDGLAYAIPKDNPFVGNKGARPEIWAYGLRNIWRMAFDRKTGRLWAADVGQNLWEEIDLIERGGNYGWNAREGLHSFGPTPSRASMIDPIWEYHHDIGKSITGGLVYRGSRVKALEGLYLYADYVSGKVWALRYDEKKKRVTANHTLRQGGFPVFSFGEDDRGEAYILTSTPTGKGIYRFAPAK